MQADLLPPKTMQSKVGTHSDHHAVGQGRESFWAPSASWKPVNLSQQSQCTTRLPEPRGQSTSREHPTQFWSKMWVKIMFHWSIAVATCLSYPPIRPLGSEQIVMKRRFGGSSCHELWTEKSKFLEKLGERPAIGNKAKNPPTVSTYMLNHEGERQHT